MMHLQIFIADIKNLRLENVTRTIIDNLNNNYRPKSFDQLKEIALRYMDIPLITEKKG